MKMQSNSTLYGIKASDSEFEGKKYSSTTFYLPAEFAQGGPVEAMGAVTVPYKLGDSGEFKKWAHLKSGFPVGGVPVACEFDVVVGKDAQGKDSAKLVLLSIKPSAAPARA